MGLIVGNSAAKDILHTLLAFEHLDPFCGFDILCDVDIVLTY
jgi:hypothetical protein